MGMPWRAVLNRVEVPVLFRATPQRDPAGGPFVRKPSTAGQSGDTPTRPRDATNRSQHPRHILIQGSVCTWTCWRPMPDRTSDASGCLAKVETFAGWERALSARLVARQVRSDPAFERTIAKYGVGATVLLYQARAMFAYALGLGILGVVSVLASQVVAALILFALMCGAGRIGLRRLLQAHGTSGKW